MNFQGDDQIPGSNILNMALTVIAKERLLYFEALGRPLNDIGQNVTEFAPAVSIVGSFQPVPRRLYETLGLDFQKSYFNLYTSNDIIDIGRDVSCDQVQFQGKLYQCESSTPWYEGLDGWVAILCISIGQVPIQDTVFGFNQNLTFPALLNTNQNFYNSNFADVGGE